MTTLRVGGLASGTSTDEVITAICSNRQAEIDSLKAKISNEKSLYSTWNAVDTEMSILKTDAANLTSYTNWNQKKVTASDSTVLNGTAKDLSVATGSYSVTVTTLAQANRYVTDAQTDTTTALGYTGSFMVDGQTVSVESTDTLTSIVTKINALTSTMTGAGAKAYLIGNSMVLESKVSGTGSDLVTSYTSGDDILTNLGMNKVANQTAATDLEATINGVKVTAKSNTAVTSFITGLSLNFTDTGTTNLTISNDTATIKSLIKTFISDYNSAMADLDTQTAVSISSSGKLTGSAGTLQGDSAAYNLKIKSRNIITSVNTNPAQMDQNYNSLQKIGIWTKDETNQLSIVDETKLDDALNNNFSSVMALFRSYGDSNGQGQGVMRLFNTYLTEQTDPTTGVITLKENGTQSNIDYNTNRLAKKLSDLAEYQAELYQHYAKMESAVANYNSQGSYLAALTSSNSSK